MKSLLRDAPSLKPTVCPGRGIGFMATRLMLSALVLVSVSGCAGLGSWYQNGFKVGPEYCQPPAPIAETWIDFENPDISSVSTDDGQWWSVFGDPVLAQLIDTASEQNLTLKTAGMRILEARARLGIAMGNRFPQTQEAYGDFARFNISSTEANSGNLVANDFDAWSSGFNASWEIDFWGRFRRAIESEDSLLNAEIENYDNVLVILQAEIATAYIQFRTLQERRELAMTNVELQKRTVEIADVQFRNGKVTELDVAQGKENLAATESLIPLLESGIRQTGNAICVLMGMPPRDLVPELGVGQIPEGPVQVLAGIPADLLRRRPDVRQAERLAAAQSAKIGIAESDFYPRIALTGFIGLSSQNFANLFDGQSFAGAIGPGFRWNILNYGRILNNVRVNEARFHQLVLDYQNTVLLANQEVEDGIVSFLKEKERVVSLTESAAQANRAVEISTIQYRGGRVSFQPVVYMQQILAKRQDELAASRGQVAADLVSIYKGLGGGWQARLNNGAISSMVVSTTIADSVEEMVPSPTVNSSPE